VYALKAGIISIAHLPVSSQLFRFGPSAAEIESMRELDDPNLDTDSIGQVVRWFSTLSESDYFLDRASGMKEIQLTV
jgi:hypothetical protein